MNRTSIVLAAVLATAALTAVTSPTGRPDLACRRQVDGSHRIERFDVDTHDTNPAHGGRYIAHSIGGTC
jgi:hypothetical protein